MDDFFRFLRSGWIGLAALPVFFPFADELAKVVDLPISNADEKIALLVINSIICSFALVIAYVGRFSLGTGAFLGAIGAGAFAALNWLAAPAIAMSALGIGEGVLQYTGLNEVVFKLLYCILFGSLTGAFTTLAARAYRGR